MKAQVVERSTRPSGLNASAFTAHVGSISVPASLPVAAFHSLMVPLDPPETIVSPSGVKATDRTNSGSFGGRERTVSLPVATSHNRRLWSKLPEARALPSGLKATD